MTSTFRVQDHPVILSRPHITYPYAWVGHIPFMYLLADILRPTTFVELGTDSGNSYLAFCQAVESLGTESRCFAVDCWEGDPQARFYGDHVYRTLAAYHDPRYGGFSKLIKAYFDEALDQFADGSVDLLHIDGLHTYEAVKHDFETWLPKLSASAVVIFHDSAVFDRDFGVHSFVDELKDRYRVFEFTHSNGLSVMQVGAEVPAAFDEFMQEAIEHPERIRAFFEAAAAALLDPETGLPTASSEAADHSVECLLYFRNDGQIFEERRSLSILHSGGVDAQFEFPMPEGARPHHVRVDPANLPGTYRIMTIGLRSGKATVNLFAEPGAQRFAVNGDVLPTGMGEGIRFVCLHNDPYVEIDLRGVWEQLATDEGDTSVVIGVAYEQVLASPMLQTIASGAAYAVDQLKEELRRERADTVVEQIASISRNQHSALQAQLAVLMKVQSALQENMEMVLERLEESSAELPSDDVRGEEASNRD